MKYYKKPELEMTTLNVDDYIATLSVIDNSNEGIEDGGASLIWRKKMRWMLLNKGWYRILSAMLSITIICGMIPSGILKASAEAEYSGVEIAYNFCSGAYSGDTGTNGRLAPYTDYTATRPWAYMSDNFKSPSPVTLAWNYIQLIAKQNERLVLKIQVPNVGRYRASISYYGYSNGGIIDIYLIPKNDDTSVNTENYIISDYLLDSVDTYQATGSIKNQSIKDAVFNTAGEYLLVFCASNKNESSGNYNMLLKNLTLNGHALSSAQITLSKSELKFGETAIANATGKISDGTDATGASITYDSSNPEIAVINTESGMITAVSEGSTNITATVTKDGVSKTATAILSVKDWSLAFSGAAITYDFRNKAYSGDTEADGRVYYKEYSATRPWAYVADTFTAPGPVLLLLNFLQLVSSQNQYLILKIKVPKAGRYRSKISYYGYSNGGIMNIYLIPKNDDSILHIENYLTSQYLLNSIDTYQATAGMKDINLNDTEFDTSGEYLLVFRAVGKNVSSGNYYMLFSKLTIDGLFMESALISLDKSEIKVGETTSATAVGKMNDGSDAAGASITYGSSNPQVATIDSASGAITSVSVGNTNITAKVTKNGISKTVTANLTVKENVLEVLSGTSITYDFRNRAYAGDIEADGRQYYKDYSETRPWAYVSDTFTAPGSVLLLLNCLQLVSSQNQYLVLKIRVPNAGRYKSSITYYGYSNGGIMNIYLVPKTEDSVAHIANYMTNSNLLDFVDTYQPSAGMNDHKLKDAVFETAGEYLLVIKSADKNVSSGYYNMLFSKITFDGSMIESVSLTFGEDTLGIDECTESNVVGYLSGDRTADLSTATVTFSSSNPTVATVDASSGEIKTVSDGETDITAIVTLDGVTKSVIKTFHVNDMQTLQSITLSGIDSLTTLSKGQLIVRGNLKGGGTLAFPADTVKFSLNDANPAGAAELLSGGCVVGRINGTVAINANVLYRGKKLESNVLTVSVRDSIQTTAVADFIFAKGVGGDVRGMKDYTSERKWAYVGDSITASGYPILNLNSCMQIVSKAGEWVALKVQISEEGNYKTTLMHLGLSGAGIMNIYLIPKTEETLENIAGFLTDAYLVDQIDGYSTTDSTLEKTLKDVYIPAAGEYLLVFKSVKNSAKSWGANMYLIRLLFEGERALKSVSLALDSSEIEAGKTLQTLCSAVRADGSVIDLTDGSTNVMYRSSNPIIASIDRNGLITANEPGDVKITARVTKDGVTAESVKNITVTDNSELLTVELNEIKSLWVGSSVKLQPTAKMASGFVINIPASAITYTIISCEPEGAATIDENGFITGICEGTIKVKGTSTFHGKTTETDTVTIPILTSFKTKSTIWTQEKRDAVQENKNKYAWAKSEVEKVVKEADKYVNSADALWNLIVPEGLPRYYHVGFKYDPEKFYCRYCGVDLLRKYGSYPWLTNPLADPWKIQCPDCKRRFPSNDFGSYYKSGLDEHGIFKKELAQQNGQAYLKNILYQEKGEGWGVDDGFGYLPGRTYSNGVVERHNYVAYYLHEGLWHGYGIIAKAIDKLAHAYAYTGEAKYGRTGAVLLDRVADFYPDFNWYQWRTFRDDNFRGKILDIVWGCPQATSFAKAYDAFFPIYEDPQVISFLSKKAKQYGMDNPKSSAAAIRKNAEDGILREIYKGCVDSNLAGNFGMPQLSIASAAIALDTMPTTKDWLDWMMRPGQANPDWGPRNGGNVMAQLVDIVDRDGMGNEAAPEYNALWLESLLNVAEMLHGYEAYPEADLYMNPKFVKMFTSQIPLIMASYYTIQTGDSGSTASTGITMSRSNNALIGFSRLGLPKLAQIVYMLNGNSINGLHEAVTVKNPELIQKKILDVINSNGTFRPVSEIMTGYGLAVLRDGAKYDSKGVDSTVNNQRDFYIYFGRGLGHGHYDCLNLGIDAYGLNMAPDLGYPEQTGTQPNNMQWVRGTLSHNTVMVNGKAQKGMDIHGDPLHFDDSGRIKVMDINAPKVYDATNIYRRTVIMVRADDNVSYGVDFFRIRGGDDHIYSFHSQSDEIYETEGLNLTPQVDADGNYIGTYAGADVSWGPDPLTDLHSSKDDNLKYLTGSTWLDAVRRDSAPQSTFAVDFKVKDFRNVLSGNPNLHLRMTMLNDFNLSEIAIAHGTPPQLKSNMKVMNTLEYVLARRTGKNLDSLYTTVYEPYQDSRYLESITGVAADIIEGTQGATDTVKAVKVMHKSGRVDYIVYATNNTIKYKIDNVFEFRGFIGVYTLLSGTPIYTYVNDGDIIGNNAENIPEITGVVEDYTRELQLNNKIIVTADQQIDPAKLTGKYIHVDNSDSPENGVYKIDGATAASNNKVILDIGGVTPIRAFHNANDITAGYLYNIEAGQEFRIPLSLSTDVSPIFEQVGKKYVDAKSQIRFSVSAESPIGKALTYRAVSLPRGASFDAKTRAFVWTPDLRQIGQHHASIEVTDGALYTTLHLEIIVLTATIGSIAQPSDPPDNPQVNTPVNPPNPSVITQTQTDEKFIDLAGYDWAKDAIYSLAKAGIITGTSKKTYSPSANITRADFAVLLVRTLKLGSDSTDNFADVSISAYYAKELAIAKDSGIAMGVGENKYNPTAEISRQDIMVIISRALIKADYKMQEADEAILSEFSDAAEVSDYAKSAVAALIKNGIVSGTGGKIKPKSNATRAEVAVLINRILSEKA